jgi:hypothetical protein
VPIEVEHLRKPHRATTPLFGLSSKKALAIDEASLVIARG